MGRHEVGYVEDVAKDPYPSHNPTGCRFRASFRINKVLIEFLHNSYHLYRFCIFIHNQLMQSLLDMADMADSVASFCPMVMECS